MNMKLKSKYFYFFKGLINILKFDQIKSNDSNRKGE